MFKVNNKDTRTRKTEGGRFLVWKISFSITALGISRKTIAVKNIGIIMKSLLVEFMISISLKKYEITITLGIQQITIYIW